MASNIEINIALIRAGEKLAGRPLTETEKAALIRAFAQSSGTEYQRAIASVSRVTLLTENQILVKAAASDDVDRAMKDLERVLKGK